MGPLVSRRELALAALVALVFTAAPTPGDVGGCGREAEILDVELYGDARKLIDCRRCRECGLTTARCGQACNDAIPSNVALPPTCRPLLHDGEVCLNALAAASCGDYRTFVDDVAPRAPTECDFCQVTEDAGSPVVDEPSLGGPP